eukprot:Polyplicarium_translucidae@DN2697_c0_g1_i6.p1
MMLEMGFRDDVDKILEFVAEGITNGKRKKGIQFLFFTATLPKWVKDLSKIYMKNPVIVDVMENGGSNEGTPSAIRNYAMSCTGAQKNEILKDVVLLYAGVRGRCIIFAETKAQANEVAMNSPISSICQVLHGDIIQSQREITLKAFKEGQFRVLVATDVAARGLHIDAVELVLQLRLPKDVDTFVHRAGRTGRAGKKGVNLALVSMYDRNALATIEEKTGIRFRRVAVPQAADLVRIAGENLVEEIKSREVDPEMISKFHKTAKALIDEKGAVEAMSIALCSLCGYDNANAVEQMKAIRSALTGRIGFKAYKIVFHEEKLQSPGVAWRALRRFFNEDSIDQLSVWRRWRRQGRVPSRSRPSPICLN